MLDRKRTLQAACGMTIVLFVGVVVGGVFPPRLHSADPVAAPTPVPSRYQISAYSGHSQPGGSTLHGAYIIDTHTGDVYHTHNANVPTTVGSLPKLPKNPLQKP